MAIFGEGHGNPLQYTFLENSMDRGVWWAAVHGKEPGMSEQPARAPGKDIYENLDSVLKSRDITLSTNVHLVKAMVFSVVMYGCESWVIKKAEH